MESELFGYEEGAFTGAKKGGKPGLFEQAHLGTIFLDEIGDISTSLQSKLLRVLQYKEVLKIGGTRLLPVDVRVIAATNRDLYQLVKEGKFREDLYYRLNVLRLVIPPLRERKEDIPLLAKLFLRRRNSSKMFSLEPLRALTQYHWPGNVRELENTIEYVSIMSDEEIIIDDLPFQKELSLVEIPVARQDDVHQSVNRSLRAPVPMECTELSFERFLLVIILEAKIKGESTGRRNLIRLKYARRTPVGPLN